MFSRPLHSKVFTAVLTAFMAVLLTCATVTLVLGTAPARSFASQDQEDDDTKSDSSDRNIDDDGDTNLPDPDGVSKLGAPRTIIRIPLACGRSAPPAPAASAAPTPAFALAPPHLQLSVRRQI